MKRIALVGLLGLGLLAALPAQAQNPAECTGTVKDHEGNPIKGAIVKLWANANPDAVFTGKTNKRGRYFVPGLMSGKSGDKWNADVEFEGYTPTAALVENRTVNRVLIGEAQTVTLRPGKKISGLPIQPLGKVTMNWTITPLDMVEEQLRQQQIAAAAEAGDEDEAPVQQTQQQSAWDKALTMVQDGDLEGSIPEFERAIEKEPESAERRGAYANVLYRLEKYPEAEAQVAKAIEMEPELIDHRMLKYSVFVRKGDYAAAGAALDEAKALNATNVNVWKQTAFLASKQGDVPGEIAAHEKVVELQPKDADSWASLGSLYNKTGAPDKSVAAYEKVVELQPSTAYRVFFNLGQLAIKENEAQKAADNFRKAIELKPDYAQAHRELGFALLNLSDVSGAKSALQEYLALAGDSPDAVSIRQYVESLK